MTLKSLSFVPLPASLRSAIDIRRAKLIERLEEQKRLLAEPSNDFSSLTVARFKDRPEGHPTIVVGVSSA